MKMQKEAHKKYLRDKFYNEIQPTLDKNCRVSLKQVREGKAIENKIQQDENYKNNLDPRERSSFERYLKSQEARSEFESMPNIHYHLSL